MNDLPWFRLYHEFISDPVIRLLAFEDQRHYIFVLCMKARGDLDKLYPSDAVRAKAIEAQLGLTPIFADEVRRRLIEVGLIDEQWQPHGWDRRQMRSDSSADRARRYRERHRETAVTSPSRDGDGLDRDTDREREEEKDIPPTTPPEWSPPGAPTDASELAGMQGKKAPSGRATRIPESFALTPERRLVGVAENLPDVERVFAKFVDHWRAKAGAAGRKVDWDATWRNWCRSETDRHRPLAPRQRGGIAPGASSWRPE